MSTRLTHTKMPSCGQVPTSSRICLPLTHMYTHRHTDRHRWYLGLGQQHTQPAPLPRDTDTFVPRNALSWYRHTQTQTEEAVTKACRHHSRPQHQYIRFISPLLSRDSRYPNLNKNRAQGWGAALWVGQNTNLTSPGLGPSPGTPPKGDWGSLCPRLVGQSRSSTSIGRVAGEQAGQQIHIHVCLLRPAASRPPATGLPRQLPPGCPQHRSRQGHEDSGGLWAEA